MMFGESGSLVALRQERFEIGHAVLGALEFRSSRREPFQCAQFLILFSDLLFERRHSESGLIQIAPRGVELRRQLIAFG